MFDAKLIIGLISTLLILAGLFLAIRYHSTSRGLTLLGAALILLGGSFATLVKQL